MLNQSVRWVRNISAALACGMLLASAGTVRAQANPPAPKPAPAPLEIATPAPLALGALYSLDQFAPKLNNPVQAEVAFAAASKQIIEKGGGVLLIPADAPAGWMPRNVTQEQIRIPEAPAPATNWKTGPGVTVIDMRGGTVRILPPQGTGLTLSRTLDLPPGQSLPHWDYFPLIELRNAVAHGSTSYRDQITEDVKAGPDARVYVNTIRGIFPGMFVNCESYGPGGVQRLYVKTLGYDKDKRAWYFTADFTNDVRKGTYLSNKNHVNIAKMTTFSHSENQTFDLSILRNHYSQGDNYLFDARFKYMGDVHSTAGDENGVCFAGFVESLNNNFRGEVESWNASTGELVFKAGRNADTLGSGRPVINHNPKKWITAGSVIIVRPASWTDYEDPHAKNPVYQGKTYPTTLATGKTGDKWLQMGGLIRFSADAPIDETVVGRYFAVNEDGEYLPETKGADAVRRWYLIDSVTKNPDGTKDIKIIRHWWGAKPAGSPTLYKPESYSSDGNIKPLKYVIAPGANAYDVSDGIDSRLAGIIGGRRMLRLAPSPVAGTSADFEPGDRIEQAVGPDPFRPIPFRSWIFENVPGAFPAPVFDVSNGGIMRNAVLAVRGGTGKLDEDLPKRYDRSPHWNDVIRVESTANVGINFMGDTREAAIQFNQKNGHPHAIKWKYGNGAKEASLIVSPADGTMKFDGNGMAVGGGFTRMGGLSGTETQARNLRGVAVTVPPGATEIAVKFQHQEADAQFAVFVETSWITARGIVSQSPEGFTVQFEKPAPAKSTLHWIVVR